MQIIKKVDTQFEENNTRRRVQKSMINEKWDRYFWFSIFVHYYWRRSENIKDNEERFQGGV